MTTTPKMTLMEVLPPLTLGIDLLNDHLLEGFMDSPEYKELTLSEVRGCLAMVNYMIRNQSES